MSTCLKGVDARREKADPAPPRTLAEPSLHAALPVVDLLIVGKVALEDVLACLSDVELSLGRAVNPTVYSAAEFKTKLGNGNHFLNSVDFLNSPNRSQATLRTRR